MNGRSPTEGRGARGPALTRWALLGMLGALGLLLAACGAAGAESLTGKVVRVVDGDTIVVLGAQKTQHRVRLGGIDAPERGQPYGRKSTDNLARLVAGKEVRVDWYKRDRQFRRAARPSVAPCCHGALLPCSRTVRCLIGSGRVVSSPLGRLQSC
jgi:hypothetical protein